MAGRAALGRRFGWLWAAYAVSSYGTGLGFGAFPLIAVVVLHCGPAEVAALAAVGRAVGALLAVPLGPWVEFRRKRPVMIAADLARFGALLTVPAAYALGWLTFGQLLLVSVVTAAADIAFKAASGAFVKSLVPREHLLAANSRFESTMWTSTTLGPPLGGAAIGVLGPVTTIVADAASYLLSALGLAAVGGGEAAPAAPPVGAGVGTKRARGLLEGWRSILGSRVLRPLFFNVLVVNGLIMVGEPLMAVLMLGHLGFAPWQYGLAFAAPCVGGLVGSRLARPLAARWGQHRVLLASGVLRAVWPIGLAFVQRGAAGLVLVMLLQFGLVTCCGVFNPLLATYRLEHTAPERIARTLSAWSVSTSASIAVLTALWGLLADAVGTRTAIGVAGALMLASPLLLPRSERSGGGPDAVPPPRPASEQAASVS